MDIDYGLAIGDRCHIEGYAWGQALLRAAGVSFFCFTIFFFFWLCTVRHNFPPLLIFSISTCLSSSFSSRTYL